MPGRTSAKYRSRIRAQAPITVKECLQREIPTPFQTLVTELRNTVMKSYWNKEVGRTHYLLPHLPVGMDPLQTTFGKKFKSDATMAEILNPLKLKARVELESKGGTKEDGEEDVQKEKEREKELITPNYYDDENFISRITRNYNEHFDKNSYFGKKQKVDESGRRIKKLLTWVNNDPMTAVNHIQADFLERNQPRIGELKLADKNCALCEQSHGIAWKDPKTVANTFQDCPMNEEVFLQWKYLECINGWRQRLKHRIPEVPFYDIYEDLYELDKDLTGVLPKEEVLKVLSKYRIYPEAEYFDPLLKALNLYKDGKVLYRKVVDLFNTKCEFLKLPKIPTMPKECQYYSTTYGETIGDIANRCDIDNKIITAITKESRVDDKYLDAQTSAYSVLFPSVFTRYGLNHMDFFKIRSKNEIRKIFENIGVKIPDDIFEAIWKEANKKDGVEDGACVETFRNILSFLAACTYEGAKFEQMEKSQ